MLISLTEPERKVVMEALAAFVRRQAMITDDHPAFTAYGRVLADDHMTLEESRSAFGDAWYVSKTGRKFLHRPEFDTPVTPLAYDKATVKALAARGREAMKSA